MSPPGAPAVTPMSFNEFVQPSPNPAFTRPENNPNLIRLQLQAMQAMSQPDYGMSQRQQEPQEFQMQRPNFMESDFSGHTFGPQTTQNFNVPTPPQVQQGPQQAAQPAMPQQRPPQQRSMPAPQSTGRSYQSFVPPMLGGTPYSPPQQQYMTPYQREMQGYYDQGLPWLFRRLGLF